MPVPPPVSRKLILPGGNGFLGRVLASHFCRAGWEVVVLTRRPDEGGGKGVRQVAWDGATAKGDWVAELDGADAVVNLAGRSVNCRYDARRREEVLQSRVRSTRALGEAIARCPRPPRAWLNSSSATIYRDARDRPMNEARGDLGDGFSVDVCRAWERALDEAPTPGTVRRLALRTAIVFGRGRGGPFEAFDRLVRLGLGGTQGPGDQFVSWIHEVDFARAVQWLIEHEEFADGPVNLAAPEPLENREFLRLHREARGQRLGLPAASWMLEIGAFVLRTETELLLKSRRVVPSRLLLGGFAFLHPDWRGAVADLVGERPAA